MRNRIAVLLLSCVVAVSVSVAVRTASASTEDEQAVRKADAGFYAALNSMFTGDLGPMKEVWSHAKDVTYMGPEGGFLVGWDQVLPSWESQAIKKMGGKVESVDTRVTVGKDLAFVETYEKGENKDANGKTQTVSIRATNLYRKEAGKWKMIGHHTDLLSFLQK